MWDARARPTLRDSRLDPRRFTLDEVADAHRLIAERQARGKLSIDIEEEAGS
jgi:hypothetical protein